MNVRRFSLRFIAGVLLFVSSPLVVTAQTTLNFEGLGNLQPIGTIAGATFSSNWLSINSCSVGGPGNFVNPPSGAGIAFILVGGPGTSLTGWCSRAEALRRLLQLAARLRSVPNGRKLCGKFPLYICASITTLPAKQEPSG
jgi:hypothetical protein